MGKTTAYDQNLPCLNPQCKSHGSPHPNCRCYGMAEGGEVGHFCSSDKCHNDDCEYYMAHGGKTEQASGDWEDVPSTQAAPQSEWEDVPSSESAPVPTPPPAPAPHGDWEDVETPDPNAAGNEEFMNSLIPGYRLAKAGLGFDTKENIQKREESLSPADKAMAGGLGAALSPTNLLGGAVLSKIPAAAKLGVTGAKVLGTWLNHAATTTDDHLRKFFLASDPKSAPDALAAYAGDLAKTGAWDATLGLLGVKGRISKFPAKTAEEIGQKGKGLLEFLGKKEVVTATNIAKWLGGAGAVGETAKEAYDIVKEDIPEHEKVEKLIKLGLWRGTEVGAAYFGKKYVAPAVMRAVGNGSPDGIPGRVSALADFARRVERGTKAMEAPIEACFDAAVIKGLVPLTNEAIKETFKKDIEDGGTVAQIQNEMGSTGEDGYAKGGEVRPSQKEPDHVGEAYPEFSVLKNIAKGRVYNYMNSLRPQKIQQKLPFDSQTPDTDKKREYEKAAEIAINPLSIMNKVNDGTLTTKEMKHLVSMWPEVHSLLSKKMTERITKAQMKDEKPPYKKRQAMSLFLGASLDSSFTPQAMQAIQMTFVNKSAQQAQQGMPQKKGSANAPSKASAPYLTDEQARERRMQNQKA